jgi:hypothetical protein
VRAGELHNLSFDRASKGTTFADGEWVETEEHKKLDVKGSNSRVGGEGGGTADGFRAKIRALDEVSAQTLKPNPFNLEAARNPVHGLHSKP